MRSIIRVAAITTACLLALSGCAANSGSGGGSQSGNQGGKSGDSFPGNTPITMLLPYSAGGSSDTLARSIQPYLAKELGAKIVVKNVVGAGGQVGLQQLASAPGDGHTIGLTNLPSSLAYLDADKKAPYDGSSFVPIGTVQKFQWIVVTGKKAPFSNLTELADAAKAKPGTLTAGTDGIGGDDHAAILQFEQLTGAKLKIVPYDSGSEKLTALLGGQIDVSFGSVPTFQAQIQTGDLKALGVLNDTPVDVFPKVPTAKSQGIDLSWGSYNVFSGPKSLDPAVKDKLATALKKAVDDAQADPAFVKRMKAGGFVIEYQDAAASRKLWDDLEATYKKLMPLMTAK